MFRHFFTSIVSLLCATAIYGASVTVAWNANPESNISGYRLHYGQQTHNYTQHINVGPVLSKTVTGLTLGGHYFFAVSAYDDLGIESLMSAELPVTIAASTPTPTPSPTASPTPTATPSPTPSPTASPTPSPTASPTPSPTASPSPSPSPTASPLPTASPTPSPTPFPDTIAISGTVLDCDGWPVQGVRLTLSGDWDEVVFSDADGRYAFVDLSMELDYTVTIYKTPLLPHAPEIDTLDVIAIQRHALLISFLPDCRMFLADVDQNGNINTVDALAVQRFALGMPGNTNHVGEFYVFPNTRVYIGVTSNQIDQNFLAEPYGDVIAPAAKNPVEKTLDRH